MNPLLAPQSFEGAHANSPFRESTRNKFTVSFRSTHFSGTPHIFLGTSADFSRLIDWASVPACRHRTPPCHGMRTLLRTLWCCPLQTPRFSVSSPSVADHRPQSPKLTKSHPPRMNSKGIGRTPSCEPCRSTVSILSLGCGAQQLGNNEY